MTQRPDPVQTIEKLIQERYPKAQAVFLAGSVAQKQGTATSDLDVVIVFDRLPNAYREAFIYEGWPVDAFIHDPETLAYFFERIDLPSFSPALPHMVAYGIQVPYKTLLGDKLQQKALELLNRPLKLDPTELTVRRFLITDLLDDLRAAQNDHEKMATVFRLYEKLAEFYLLAHHQWIGSGKQLVRRLADFNQDAAKQFCSVFQNPQDTEKIIAFAEDLLKPFGGVLWHGFRSDAPASYRVTEDENVSQIIQQLELALLEPSNRKSIDNLNRRIADDFMEIGSLGKIYTKQDVLHDLPLEDSRKFVVEDFLVKVFLEDVALTTYKVTEGSITSLRSSIWKRVDGEWAMVFHQGTRQL